MICLQSEWGGWKDGIIGGLGSSPVWGLEEGLGYVYSFTKYGCVHIHVCFLGADGFRISGTTATPVVGMPVVGIGPLDQFGRLALCVLSLLPLSKIQNLEYIKGYSCAFVTSVSVLSLSFTILLPSASLENILFGLLFSFHIHCLLHLSSSF